MTRLAPVPVKLIENWFALMCSELRNGDISEDRFVADAHSVGVPASRIEDVIARLKQEDGVYRG